MQIVRSLRFSASVPHGGPVKIMTSKEHDLNFVEHLNFAFVGHARRLVFIYCRHAKHSPSTCTIDLYFITTDKPS